MVAVRFDVGDPRSVHSGFVKEAVNCTWNGGVPLLQLITTFPPLTAMLVRLGARVSVR